MEDNQDIRIIQVAEVPAYNSIHICATDGTRYRIWNDRMRDRYARPGALIRIRPAQIDRFQVGNWIIIPWETKEKK